MRAHFTDTVNAGATDTGTEVWRHGPARNWRTTLQGMTTRIRELRKTRGLTLQQLAEQAGTTAQTIQRLETDNMSVSVDWLLRIAPALGVSPAALLETSGTERSATYLGHLNRDCIVTSAPAGGRPPKIPIDVPGQAPLAVLLTDRIGPYEPATVLIADRQDDIAEYESANGRDCLVKTHDGSMLFRQIMAGSKGGLSGAIALLPYTNNRTVDRDVRINWIAPVLMAVRYL
jgi:transcriptional regulator with XRE-family HTH domain